MKKSKKLFVVLITTILGTALFLAGCGEKPVAADVTVKAFYNLYILGDSTEVEKIALTKDEVKQVLDEIKTTSQDKTKSYITQPGFQVTDAELDSIFAAQMEALKKLTVTTELISEDGDNATVKLTTNYVDMTAIDMKAGEDAQKETDAMGLTDTTDWSNKFIELFKNKLIEGLKTAQPSTETKEEVFECEKKTYNVDGKNKEIFALKDMGVFGICIGTMTSGQ